MPLRLLKDYLRRRELRRLGIERQLDLPVYRAGARSGVWAVYPDLLSAESVVYSFGVGDNIAWDLALIERFGLTVHAFDPTPRSRIWIESQRLPASFHYHPVGLAGHDGSLRFALPKKPGNCNCMPCEDGPVEAPVRRLSSLLEELGHQRLDILKMDIEGSEYPALRDLLGSRIRPMQILVEFHHHLAGYSLKQTQEAIGGLLEAGYRVLDISSRGLEFSFLLDGRRAEV